MTSRKNNPQGITDQLRSAIERTFDATFGEAGLSREKAQDLVDDAVSAAERLRKELRNRGEDIRTAASDELKTTRKRIDTLEKRFADLEAKLRPGGGKTASRKSASPAAKARPVARKPAAKKPAAKKPAAKKPAAKKPAAKKPAAKKPAGN